MKFKSLHNTSPITCALNYRTVLKTGWWNNIIPIILPKGGGKRRLNGILDDKIPLQSDFNSIEHVCQMATFRSSGTIRKDLVAYYYAIKIMMQKPFHFIICYSDEVPNVLGSRYGFYFIPTYEYHVNNCRSNLLDIASAHLSKVNLMNSATLGYFEYSDIYEVAEFIINITKVLTSTFIDSIGNDRKGVTYNRDLYIKRPLCLYPMVIIARDVPYDMKEDCIYCEHSSCYCNLMRNARKAGYNITLNYIYRRLDIKSHEYVLGGRRDKRSIRVLMHLMKDKRTIPLVDRITPFEADMWLARYGEPNEPFGLHRIFNTTADDCDLIFMEEGIAAMKRSVKLDKMFFSSVVKCRSKVKDKKE